MGIKLDMDKMMGTSKDGTFPIRKGDDGIVRWVVKPTPGSVAPSAEEHKAALDEINARTTALLGGTK